MPAVITTVVIVFLIVLAVGISSSGPNNSIAYGVQSHQYKTAPDQTRQLPVLAGSTTAGGRKSLSLSDYRGKLVLVNLFASWCVQCQLEAHVLSQAQKLLAAHGGTVLGVTYQNSPSAALGFVKKYGVDYPAVSDDAGKFADAYNVTNGVPDSYLVSPAGKIVWLNLYQLTPAFVKTTLPALIAKWA